MSEEHMRFNVTVYRDINGYAYTQVTVSCECGRAGYVRIPEQPAHKVDDEGSDMVATDLETKN